MSGCDLQIAVFLSLLLFWCTKQQRTSPQTTSPRSLHLLHDANKHHHSRDDATFHTSATTIFTTRHSASTVRSRSTRDGWRSGVAAAATSRQDLPPKTPAQDLPPKTPAQTAPAKTHPPQNPKRGEEGGGVACRLPIGGAPPYKRRDKAAQGRRRKGEGVFAVQFCSEAVLF